MDAPAPGATADSPPAPPAAVPLLLRFFPSSAREARANRRRSAAAPSENDAPDDAAGALAFSKDAHLKNDDDEDHQVLVDWLRYGATHGVAFWNWAPNEDTTLAQPQGYALALGKDAHFQRDPFMSGRLCFGVSVFRVRSLNFMETLPEREVARIKTVWNRIIPDTSPDPPTPTSAPNEPWVASVTPGGSIRLLKWNADPDSSVWYLYVASGLPLETEERARDAMAQWEGGLPDVSTTSSGARGAASSPRATFTAAAAEHFEPLIRLSEENRARLACLAAELAGFQFVGLQTSAPVARRPSASYDGVQPPSLSSSDASALEAERVELALAFLGFKEPIPVWYRVPSEAPAGFTTPGSEPTHRQDVSRIAGFELGRALLRDTCAAAPKPQMIAYAAEPVVCNTWNVLVRADARSGVDVAKVGAVWYSECTSFCSGGGGGLVAFDDPTKGVRVFNWPLAALAQPPRSLAAARDLAHDSLGAFPGVVPRRLGQGAQLRARDFTDERRDDGSSYHTPESGTREALKHFTLRGDGPGDAFQSTMVLARWWSSEAAASWASWRFERAEAVFTTVLARHAALAYDGRDHLPSAEELEFDV